MNNIQIFENENFGEIRTIVENEEILFCATDIAKALGYTQPHKATERHCKRGMVRNIPHPQSKDKTIEMKFIPEGLIY